MTSIKVGDKFKLKTKSAIDLGYKYDGKFGHKLNTVYTVSEIGRGSAFFGKGSIWIRSKERKDSVISDIIEIISDKKQLNYDIY